MTTNCLVTFTSDSIGEMMHELRQLGNATLRDAMADLQSEITSAHARGSNLPTSLEQRDWDSAREERENLEATCAQLRSSLEQSHKNYQFMEDKYNAIANECEHHKATIERQKHELDNYRRPAAWSSAEQAVNEEPSNNKTLFNREYVAQKEVEANEKGYVKGYADGYAKGRDEQIAEHAQERVDTTPQRLLAMANIMTHSRVKVRASEDAALFEFEPRKIINWGKAGKGTRAYPDWPNDNATVGIVGMHVTNGEAVFLSQIYEWTPRL